MNRSDLVCGVPKEARRQMEVAAEKLFKEGFLERKPGNRKEFRYSLNPARKTEIDGQVHSHLKKKGIDFSVF